MSEPEHMGRMELIREVERLRAALADLLGNTGCMCDHPYVVGPCAKCRAARVLDA